MDDFWIGSESGHLYHGVCVCRNISIRVFLSRFMGLNMLRKRFVRRLRQGHVDVVYRLPFVHVHSSS